MRETFRLTPPSSCYTSSGNNRHKFKSIQFKCHPSDAYFAVVVDPTAQQQQIRLIDLHGEECIEIEGIDINNVESGSGNSSRITFMEWNPLNAINLKQEEENSISSTKHKDILLAWIIENGVGTSTSSNIVAETNKSGLFSQLCVWKRGETRAKVIEHHIFKPMCMSWNVSGQWIVVGTLKGSAVLYDSYSNRSVKIRGGGAAVLSCAWTETNEFILSTEDCSLSIYNIEGHIIHKTQMSIKVGFIISNGFEGLSHRCLLLPPESSSSSPDSILIQSFDDSDIITLPTSSKVVLVEWLSCDEFFAVYTSGLLQFFKVSNGKYHEVSSTSLQSCSIVHAVYSPRMEMIFLVDDKSTLFLYKISEHFSLSMKGDPFQFENIVSVSWARGMIIVSTEMGELVGLSTLGSSISGTTSATFGHIFAQLLSNNEVSIINSRSHQSVGGVLLNDRIDCLSLSQSMLAVASQNTNTITLYHHTDGRRIHTSYCSWSIDDTVDSIQCTDTMVAVESGKQMSLYSVDTEASKTPFFTFDTFTCYCLHSKYICFGNEEGRLLFYDTKKQRYFVNLEYQHKCDIIKIFPDQSGTHLVFVDKDMDCLLYNLISRQIMLLKDAPGTVSTVLWDDSGDSVFSIFDGSKLHIFSYVEQSIQGELVTKVGPVVVGEDGSMTVQSRSVTIDNDLIPIIKIDNKCFCRSKTKEGLIPITSPTFFKYDPSEDDEVSKFSEMIVLNRLDEAFKCCLKLNKQKFWLALASKSMYLLEVEFAARVYKVIGNASMATALEGISNVCDLITLSGHVNVLLGNYDKAQDCFIKGNKSVCALDMRIDLGHWEQALALVEEVCPANKGMIEFEYAKYLESNGDYKQGLEMYEKAYNGSKLAMRVEDFCKYGQCRCFARLGEVRRCLMLVKKIGNVTLTKQCGDIFYGMNLKKEASTFYQLAGMYDKAANILLDLNEFQLVSDIIIKHVRSSAIHIRYGALCENEGQYELALSAYKKAQNIEGMVRLLLVNLNRPEEAAAVVKDNYNSRAAHMLAEYFYEQKKYRNSMEYYVLSGNQDQAYTIGKSHECIDEYVELLDSKLSPTEARDIAVYYETNSQWKKAADLFFTVHDFDKTLSLYLQCGETAIDNAIAVVGQAQRKDLSSKLIDYLIGDIDGTPKDSFYILKLYNILGNYDEAAKTALAIAEREFELGDTNNAVHILVKSIRELEDSKAQIPGNIIRMLETLHSFRLAKAYAEKKDHEATARLLYRISQSVSNFPLARQFPILISAVIECQKAGLKKSAHECAEIICSSYYNELKKSKFRKNIEELIRRPDLEEFSPNMSECPITREMIPEFDIVTPDTKESIPMCIVSGKHMVLSDWTVCPKSKLYTLYSEYVQYVKEFGVDPIFGEELVVEDLRKFTIEEAEIFVKAWRNKH